MDNAISWNEPFQDSENLDTMMLARIASHKVLARLCQEAVEDKGFARCKSLAEQKILAAVKSGKVPEEIVVKTTDFPRSWRST